MPKSLPSLSRKARQPVGHRARLVVNTDVARDSPASPESEDSSSEGSSESQHGYGIDTLPLPKDKGEFVADVPPSPASPKAQDELAMDADMSEDGSMSPQSQYSYGIMSTPLPEPQDNLAIPAVRISGAEDGGSEVQPVAVAQDLDFDMTEHREGISIPSATAGDPGAALPDAEDVVEDHSAGRAWTWGEPAPPRRAKGKEKEVATAVSQTPEVENELSNPSRNDDRSPAEMLAAELDRLRYIQYAVYDIYKDQRKLVGALESMVKELEGGQVQKRGM